MAEIGDDVPPGRQSLSLVAPFPPNTDFCMSSTVPPRSSQNYRLNQKCSPSSSTGVSSGTAMDLESAGSSPTSQPGAYMVNMRAAGALPGWASTRRGWNATRHSFFDSFRARPSSIPPELRIVQNVQIEMQEIPNEQGSAPDVVDDCVEISDSNEKEQQCGRRSTWIKIIVLGLTFGTIIAIVVAFVVDGNSSDSTKLPIVNNTSSDYLGADGISTRSSDVQAAVEVYMPLVLSISNATALADSSSAQSKALTWLASSVRLDPETKKSNMSNQRVLTRYALAVLYYSTLGHMWLDSFGFLGPDSHECDWNLPLDDSFEVVGLVLDKQGVICNVGDGNSERYVEILNFDTNNLQGTFPDSEMNAFEQLKVAIFAQNSIRGTLPSHWNPSSLVYLDLSYNQLSSTIPGSLWRRAAKMTHLLLRNNELSGTLSAAVGHAKNLKTLRLDHNDLDGSLPQELGRLSQLHEFGLEHNRFSRTLPAGFGQLASLSKLNLNHNAFTGEFPWRDFGVRETCVMTDLNLSSNYFKGLIPWDVLSDPSQIGWGCLKQLTLKSSGFASDVLPESVFDNWEDTLKHLDIGDTLLRGPIPETISKLSVLEFLDLGINALTGTIPVSITELKTLHTLNIYYNMLNGTLPSEVGLMTSLTKIDVMGNQLNGMIPDSLGNLSSLEILHLRQNQLTGPIPAILAQLSDLQVLTVAINNLQGSMEGLCTSEQKFIDLTSDCISDIDCSCCTRCY